MSVEVAEEFLPIGADALLYYEDAETEVVGTVLTAGTVTYVLKDADEATVTSGTYTHRSDGDYYATIDRAVTATLARDDLYHLEVTYTDAAGNDDFRRIPLYARYRGNS